jgi:isochorismate pyruvate lyase
MIDNLASTNPVPAEKCQNMVDVRAGVDAIDRSLVKLLSCRFAYMDAAARIKLDRNAVRDEGRKAEVIDKVVASAAEYGLHEEMVTKIWEVLVEASICYELEQWDQKQQ